VQPSGSLGQAATGWQVAATATMACPAAMGSSVWCADVGVVCGAVSTWSLGTGGDRGMGWKMDGWSEGLA
jgi:hypothetical protein